MQSIISSMLKKAFLFLSFHACLFGHETLQSSFMDAVDEIHSHNGCNIFCKKTNAKGTDIYLCVENNYALKFSRDIRKSEILEITKKIFAKLFEQKYWCKTGALGVTVKIQNDNNGLSLIFNAPSSQAGFLAAKITTTALSSFDENIIEELIEDAINDRKAELKELKSEALNGFLLPSKAFEFGVRVESVYGSLSELESALLSESLAKTTANGSYQDHINVLSTISSQDVKELVQSMRRYVSIKGAIIGNFQSENVKSEWKRLCSELNSKASTNVEPAPAKCEIIPVNIKTDKGFLCILSSEISTSIENIINMKVVANLQLSKMMACFVNTGIRVNGTCGVAYTSNGLCYYVILHHAILSGKDLCKIAASYINNAEKESNKPALFDEVRMVQCEIEHQTTELFKNVIDLPKFKLLMVYNSGKNISSNVDKNIAYDAKIQGTIFSPAAIAYTE